jgi:EAL domain-containing protein (putative c-di-GMP-specific phosphodiesterase class I)
MRIPFTELKIDRSFVGVCHADPEAWKIVRATLSLARELGVRVVAEGIETAAVNDMLRAAGCEMGQGWFHGRSIGAQGIMNLINADSARRAQPVGHQRLAGTPALLSMAGS